MEVIYRSMGVLVEQPWLGAMPIGVFMILFALSRKLLVLAAALAWSAYVPYEYGMKLRLLCSGECNIRIDLLVLYPALVGISLVALVTFTYAVVTRRMSRE
jgi:hypothetical protein